MRLQSTEDPFGIESSFTYDDAGQIIAMTTPYGTTRFNLSDPYVHTGANLIRYVEATDPLGQTERVEFNIGVTSGVAGTLESPQPNPSLVNFSTSYTNYRNTFYWDKLLTKLAPGDHQKARLYHWLHADANTVSGILESEVSPLESRVFYNYPGQPNPIYIGSLAFPSVVARVVTDANGTDQTQATKFLYNAQANATNITDPLGRQPNGDRLRHKRDRRRHVEAEDERVSVDDDGLANVWQRSSASSSERDGRSGGSLGRLTGSATLPTGNPSV